MRIPAIPFQLLIVGWRHRNQTRRGRCGLAHFRRLHDSASATDRHHHGLRIPIAASNCRMTTHSLPLVGGGSLLVSVLIFNLFNYHMLRSDTSRSLCLCLSICEKGGRVHSGRQKRLLVCLGLRIV